MALTPGQQRCVDVLDEPLAVSAGAGSGKTFTLTRRIVHALESGFLDDISQVLAITFTSKAAGEIKSRVKSALRACGMADQALKVDEAWVSTIHGMCSRVLRAHALELGIDPQFKVADEAQVSLMLDDALEAVLGGEDDLVRVAQGIDPHALDALFAEYPVRSVGPRGGGSIESMVRSLVEAASAHPDGMASIQLPPEPQSPIRLAASLGEAANDALSLASAVKPGKRRDEFLAATADGLDKLGEVAAMDPPTYRDLLDAACALPVPGRAFGRKDAWGEQAPELAERYLAVVAQARAALAHPHLETLVALAADVLAAFSARKRALGLLDNNDLLAFAARAFRDCPSVAADYRDRFKLVMVDEFQDTDQLQVDMVKRMAGEGFARLCTVGDAQQSIYRFRGADVSVYRRHLADVEARNPEGLIELPDSFRSHADILALCDRVFEQPQVFGKSFMSLAPGRDESKVKRPFLGAGPRVEVQVTTVPHKGVPADVAVRESARRVAASFSRLHEAGHEPGDMVVLLGGMRNAGVYADELRAAGLPCVIAGGSIFNQAPEVRLMVRLAEAVANPRWTSALFEVLSSEMFALSADDLLQLSTGRDRERDIPRRRGFDVGFRAVSKGELAASPALESVSKIMGKARAMIGRVALWRIMQGVVVESGWLSRLEAQGAEGLARAANVYKVIRLARDVEASGGMGPAGIARDLAFRVSIAKEAPGALSARGDSVRIMTIHASKGLEFPIVAVGEMRADGARSATLCSCTVDGRSYVSLDAGASLLEVAGKASSIVSKAASYQPYAELDEDELACRVVDAGDPAAVRAAIRLHEERGEAAESRRLLYVALTRAKEALVLALRGKRTKDDPTGLAKSAYGDVQTALAGQGGVFEPGVTTFDFGGERPAVVERVDLEADAGAVAGEAGAAAGGSGEAAAVGESIGECGGALGEATPCDDAEPIETLPSDASKAGDSLTTAPDAPFAISAGLIPIPPVKPYREIPESPYAPTREGVLSYSAIADGVGDDVREELACLGEGAEGAGAPRALSSLAGARDSLEERGSAGFGTALAGAFDPAGAAPFESAPAASAPSSAGDPLSPEPVYDEDDAAWETIRRSLSDPDKATSLGTAFHRLAQLSVIGRSRSGGSLVKPSKERERALVRSCGLDESQRARLDVALDCWFGSELARHVACCDDVRAEVPFLIEVDGARRLFLEGEIDLLAIEGVGGRALIIDYKTGGDPYEQPDELRRKHALQAACYAYALLERGCDEVEAVFVRVEQPEGGLSGEPQQVRYLFRRDDAEELRKVIAGACAGA